MQMEIFLNKIKVQTSEFIDNFISKVSNEYDIPIKDLYGLLESNKVILKKKEERKEEKKIDTKYCIYTFQRGEKSGETCGKKIKEGSYCSAHQKCKKKEFSKEESSTVSNNDDKFNVPKSKNNTPKTSPSKEIKFRPHSSGYHYHPQSNLVIDPETKKEIIGKLVDNEFKPLEEEDLKVCKKYGFKFRFREEKNQVDSESESEDEDDNIPSKSKSKFIFKTENESSKKFQKKISSKDESDSEEDLVDLSD
jgi:hypothetical protein